MKPLLTLLLCTFSLSSWGQDFSFYLQKNNGKQKPRDLAPTEAFTYFGEDLVFTHKALEIIKENPNAGDFFSPAFRKSVLKGKNAQRLFSSVLNQYQGIFFLKLKSGKYKSLNIINLSDKEKTFSIFCMANLYGLHTLNHDTLILNYSLPSGEVFPYDHHFLKMSKSFYTPHLCSQIVVIEKSTVDEKDFSQDLIPLSKISYFPEMSIFHLQYQ